MKIINKYLSGFIINKLLKRQLYLTSILLLSLSLSFAQDNQSILLSGKRILILGDSITMDGTYVSFMEYYLESLYPDKKFDIISIGLGGETTCGLTEPGHFKRPCIFSRLDSALSQIKPKLVFACYGMNDGLYNPQSLNRFQSYKDGILKLIKKIKAYGAKVIILTPTVFDPLRIPQKVLKDNETGYTYSKPYYKYDNVLADYSKWIMSLKIKNVQTIDLHSPMKKYLLKRHKEDHNFFINKDGIHPTPFGHLLMTNIILDEIGIPLHIENLDKEFKRVTSDTLFKMINKQRQIRSKGWLEYIGYTARETVKSNNIDSTKIKVSELQKQIDKLRQEIKK
ncbi:MAG: SGNH/GDSL hydrolase family protein [Ignavibacteriaceae bacterium]